VALGSTAGPGENPASSNDGDAHGRRHLLGGVVMAMLVLSHLDHREKP
jgi:hypothetical protein